jgi:hypothetical protein
LPIVKYIADTFFIWDTHSLPAGNKIWLRLKGYSADTTLFKSGTVELKSNTTGVHEIERIQEIKVYPNPSAGQFTIEGENIRKVELIDMNGKTMYSSLIIQSGQSFDTGALPAGTYFVKIITDHGPVTRILIIK